METNNPEMPASSTTRVEAFRDSVTEWVRDVYRQPLPAAAYRAVALAAGIALPASVIDHQD